MGSQKSDIHNNQIAGLKSISVVEKPIKFKETWMKLLTYCKKYWAIVIVALIFAMLGTIFTLFGPDKLSELTNLITNGLTSSIDMEAIKEIGILLSVIYVLSLILSYTQGVIMSFVTQKISKSLRTQISEKINRLPMKYFQEHSTGDILSRVTNDVDTISNSLNQSIGTIVTSGTLLIGSLIMMIKTNIMMTLAGVASVFVGFIFMMLILKKSQKYFVKQQNHLGDLNGHVEETYSGHVIVRSYNGKKQVKARFKELNCHLKDSAFRAQALSGLMMPIMTFIGNFGYVVVCVVGAILTMNESITFGVIVAFMMYIRYFTQPLSQLAQAFQNLQSAAAAGERVFEFIEATEMEDESHKTKKLENVQGNVEFEHVHFGYEKNETIINDFTASVKKGQKIAIVGPTGAGKTTLVNLLMRFYDIQGGSIKIDGVKTDSLKRNEVHKQFCMVLQDTWLFEGTIKENIVYSNENISDETVIEACVAVGLDHYINTLSNGYDTVLNDQVNLSQGQKQQLTIARAMISNNPMLILDEATSSVDTRTELVIQEAMDKLMHNRTSFVIAHRLSTIKNADLILVLKDGDIVESGKHEELLKLNGFYAELYNSQFEERGY